MRMGGESYEEFMPWVKAIPRPHAHAHPHPHLDPDPDPDPNASPDPEMPLLKEMMQGKMEQPGGRPALRSKKHTGASSMFVQVGHCYP